MNTSKCFSVVFVIIIVGLSFLSSCTKDFSRRACVLTESMDKPTAMASGKVIDLGQTTIINHGFCWDSMGFPSIDSRVIQLGKLQQTGGFSVKIPGLSPNKVYYIKAWVSSQKGIEYGDLLSFITPDLPSVILQVPTEITDTSVNCSVDVSSDGGAPIVGRGLCWKPQQAPDTNSAVFRDSILSIGSFNHSIRGLAAATKYFIRAYARNIYGIRYSDEATFTTAQGATIPVVTTSDASNIGINTITSGGEVTFDGGEAVTVRGVCWSTSPYPIIDQNKTSDGAGQGQFVSTVSGLNANTTYYLRAYATNDIGTGYGEEKTFTTLPNPGIPTVITASITNITSTSATSGGTVLNDGGADVTVRGICWSTSPNPVSSDFHTIDGAGLGSFVSEITGLVSGTKYYVRAYAANSAGTAYGNEGSFTAGQSITAPTVTTTEVVNIAQTTATCGGNVTSDGGAPVTVRGVCWSTSSNPTTSDSKTENGSGTGGYLSSITGLTENTTYHVRAYATNSAGTSYGNQQTFSTLQNPTLPTVSTTVAFNITSTTATTGGNVNSDGGSAVTIRGVCYSTSPNPTLANSFTTEGVGTGVFVSNLTGLSAGTLYYVRAYATNSIGTDYGNEVSFTTIGNNQGTPCPGIPTVIYNGQTYNTIQINSQCWLKESLNVGIIIDSNQNQTNNGIIEKFCYHNDPAHCGVYGGLYMWEEAMQYVITPGAQGICPAGWHIPTDTEWNDLASFLGGLNIAGGKLKETGLTHWWSPNTGASNETGFTGIPGGFRDHSGHWFGDMGGNLYMYSSTQLNQYDSKKWNLNWLDGILHTMSGFKTDAVSIRCIKN